MPFSQNLTLNWRLSLAETGVFVCCNTQTIPAGTAGGCHYQNSYALPKTANVAALQQSPKG